MHQFDQLDLVWRLTIALGLSALIGLEREMRQKSAGLRTYALVGTGAALFMLVSQYGFRGVLGHSVVLDPSRIAAQIVSGIGFIGGGLIFVHRSNVRGLTTAAGIWATAAVGMAVGGDLLLLASAMTLIYLIISYAFPPLTARLPSSRGAGSTIELTYVDGQGVLRRLLRHCSNHGFAISDLQAEHPDGENRVTVRLELRGRGSIAELAVDLDAVDGVLDVRAGDINVPVEA